MVLAQRLGLLAAGTRSEVSKHKTEVVDLILTQNIFIKLMKNIQNCTRRGMKRSLAAIYPSVPGHLVVCPSAHKKFGLKQLRLHQRVRIWFIRSMHSLHPVQ